MFANCRMGSVFWELDIIIGGKPNCLNRAVEKELITKTRKGKNTKKKKFRAFLISCFRDY